MDPSLSARVLLPFRNMTEKSIAGLSFTLFFPSLSPGQMKMLLWTKIIFIFPVNMQFPWQCKSLAELQNILFSHPCLRFPPQKQVPDAWLSRRKNGKYLHTSSHPTWARCFLSTWLGTPAAQQPARLPAAFSFRRTTKLSPFLLLCYQLYIKR